MHPRIFTILRLALFAGLLLWGGHTLLTYVSIPVHQVVLLTDGDRQAIEQACGGTDNFCSGWKSLWPFVTHTIGRARPFLGYGLLSLLVFAVLLGRSFFRDGSSRVQCTFSPLRLLGCFVAALWLLFTVLSVSNSDDGPFRRLLEPLPQVYVNAGPQALQALSENFTRLKDGGCLSYVGQTNNGAGVYDMKIRCMQMSFVTRVLTQLVSILALLFVLLVFGRTLLHLLRIRPQVAVTEVLFSAGLGACGLIVVLWLLALAGLYTSLAGWLLLLVIPAAFYPHSLYWLRRTRDLRWQYDAPWSNGALILGWLLVTYLAFNFLNVVRPFPIGWDDLGKYLNQPRLLVSYGHAIPTIGTLQWEYLTSLGFLLFGYDSVFGATLSMMINWMAGLLAALTVYGFGRVFLGAGRGILAALLYYSLPLVGHFSFADMKVDNAVFTMGALSMFAVFLALFPAESDDEDEVPLSDTYRLIALGGIFSGFAFSLKATAIMVTMALLTMLFGVLVHWVAFVGVLAFAWIVFMQNGLFNVPEISKYVYGARDVLSKGLFRGVFASIGVITLAIAGWLRSPQAYVRPVRLAAIFLGTFLLSIAPWVLYNNFEYGNVIPKLQTSPPNRLSPSFTILGEETPDYGQDIKTLPPELALDPKHPACQSTAKVEELDRYWGNSNGWSHYLTLPWRSVMNLDSVGYYVTTIPALLLFPLLLLLPYFWSRRGRWLRWLWVATLFMLVQWMFFANGIPWYGIGMFFGLCIGLEALIVHAPDRWNNILASVLIGLSLFVAFGMRFWQYEQQRNIFEFAFGKVSYEAMRERTIPHYDDIRDIVEQRFLSMPERPYVYRVGTFIPYFIPRNLEVLPVADHQLDFFKCLNQEKDATITLKRLQALGFNSIIFDTNTQTIERDPNGSLHQKVNDFVAFLNTPNLGLRIIVNDPDGGVAFVLLP